MTATSSAASSSASRGARKRCSASAIRTRSIGNADGERASELRRGAHRARAQRGLILCALYGEAPERVEALARAGAARPGVVGIDLAGGSTPGHAFRLSDYAAPFRLAAELGLGRTVHAGEGRPSSEIRTAIEEVGVQRIGRRTTLLGDPAVVELVRERGITIEACVTSNLHTGVIPQVADHPLPRWLELGVRACICTDNTLLCDVDAVEEHARVRVPAVPVRPAAGTRDASVTALAWPVAVRS